jgi:DNA repair protein RadA/Sms
MAKSKTVHTCTECGGQTLKWQGQCPHCSAWNTLVETVAEKAASRFQAVAGSSKLQKLSEVEAHEEERRPTGIAEFDRVLGGGLVRGAVVLLGGDPGIGKSTLLLQALALMDASCNAVYVSGEESAQQIAMRARRLAVEPDALNLLTEIQLEKIIAVLARLKSPMSQSSIPSRRCIRKACNPRPAAWRRCGNAPPSSRVSRRRQAQPCC